MAFCGGTEYSSSYDQHRCFHWPVSCRYTPYHPEVWRCSCILCPNSWCCHSWIDSTSSHTISWSASRTRTKNWTQHRSNVTLTTFSDHPVEAQRRILLPRHRASFPDELNTALRKETERWNRQVARRIQVQDQSRRCSQTVASCLFTIHRLQLEHMGGPMAKNWHGGKPITRLPKNVYLN